jgi:hypothetical protein
VKSNRNRKAGAHAATQAKIRELFKKVEEWKFEIEPMDMGRLLEKANQLWMLLHHSLGKEYQSLPLSRQSDPHFLIVYYLRDRLLCNGDVIRVLHRRFGNRKAKARLNERACAAIVEVYPNLREEVERQKFMSLYCRCWDLRLRYQNSMEGENE